uniref:Uncharacterized protein n=1 Tax=Arundo donax TaxID=35708 RepID=A0A0A9CE70_ARUDO
MSTDLAHVLYVHNIQILLSKKQCSVA